MTTSAEIIYQRRVRVLALADEVANVSEACRLVGVSRTRFYEWKRLAEAYGLEALWPKDRRRAQLSNETPTHVVADLLAIAVVEPRLGVVNSRTGSTSSAIRSVRPQCSGSSSRMVSAGACNAWLGRRQSPR